jgi:hypothetical protein
MTIAFAFVSGTVAATTPPTPANASASSDTAVADRSRPTRTECISAHRNAQELKRSGKLVESQQQLLLCSSATCPGALISDCGNWLNDLDQVVPSLVLVVRVDGKEGTDAQLFVDDQPILETTHAIKVNPGRHSVRAELRPFGPYEESVLMAEGQRMRIVSIDFKSPSPTLALPPAPRESSRAVPLPSNRPVPVLVYPLLGAGLAGLASFGVFAAIGKSKQGELEKQCEPRCTDSDLRPMKTAYLIGDISAGVGAVALLGAAIAYFARPAEEPAPAPALSFGMGPAGNVVGQHRSLAVSMTAVW